MIPPIAELTRTSQQYGDVTALNTADLVVRRGELLAVVGPEGSGKSTLLHTMGALCRPSAGRVRVDGREVARLSDRELLALRAETVGFVSQRDRLPSGVAALDTVADGLLFGGGSRDERRQLAELTLRGAGLGHRLLHQPHQLSAGERRRVSLARAMAGGPVLLLADEPTGGLEADEAEAVVGLLHTWHRAGTTVVVATRDHALASSLPREVRLRDGHIAHDSAAVPVPVPAPRAPVGTRALTSRAVHVQTARSGGRRARKAMR
ncbi:ABC transporter ATP-binding protein [Streptomyces daliensis]|uniref:ABC transporter ATP-binding protein n=1 Tax=Streptomyces daliensis TaxID=299421 RepID=A0A8T4IYR3_9ACTN|nr:ABC transporter ATP-binding protein [Streptomyces daliensis]